MMWTLIILAAGGSTAATQSSLAQCQQSFQIANRQDVREAYCLSVTGDKVYIIKDGKSLLPS
jgi:hypothetical protein